MQKTIDRHKIQTGWKVYSRDGAHLGTVNEVGDDHVLIQKGFFFPRDVYIPLTALEQRDDEALWVNVAKDDIDTQGWDVAPVTDRDTARIQVHQEELDVHKTARQSGEVQVRKDVIEEQRTIDVPVMREDVNIRRTPVDRPATDAEASFREGQETVRVPVMTEDVEVTKRPRVIEEIEIEKVARQDNQRVGGTVRREEVNVTKDAR